jgi:hypothetical protein
MKPVIWSYSSLDLFKQCPHKYYRLRVVKDVKEPYQEHLSYGLKVHKAAENYIEKGTPIPPEYAEMLAPIEKFKEMDGEKLCEYRMGLTRNLEPCKFSDKNVWWRGIADLIVIKDDGKAYIVDYKTSKSSKFADMKQLEILSLALFKHFPHVKKVKAGLLFVVANDFVTSEFEADTSKPLWTKWFDDSGRLEKAFELNVWNPRPNFTCSQWCPVKDCVHNGKVR